MSRKRWNSEARDTSKLRGYLAISTDDDDKAGLT